MADVGHLVRDDEMVLRIYHALNIVPDDSAAPTACGHRARIGVRQRNLLVLRLQHLRVQRVQTPDLLTQGRDLLVEPRDLGLWHSGSLTIRGIKLREIALDAFVDLLQAPLHLGLSEVPIPRVDRLELAAIDRNARVTQQIDAVAKRHKLAADFADRLAIVLAKIGDRLEIRRQAARQPDEFDVALAFPLKTAARLDAIEIAIDVKLQQRRGMVARPACGVRLNSVEAEIAQLKLVDKNIDSPNRVVVADIVVKQLRK